MKSSDQEIDFQESNLAFLQQIFGYLSVDSKLGGRNLPKEMIQCLFNFNIKFISDKFSDIKLTNEALVLIQHRKAVSHLERQEQSIIKSIQILFGFGREISPVNKIIRKYQESKNESSEDEDS